MSGFPLYDNLSKDLSAKKDLTVKQKTDLIKNINLIDQDGQELVYALIYTTISTTRPIANLTFLHTKEIPRNTLKFTKHHLELR